jgi:hypothetical protein
MMKKLLLWGLIVFLVVIGLGLAVRSQYVLDSRKLDAAIKKDLPIGTAKANVLEFIQARKPKFGMT